MRGQSNTSIKVLLLKLIFSAKVHSCDTKKGKVERAESINHCHKITKQEKSMKFKWIKISDDAYDIKIAV